MLAFTKEKSTGKMSVQEQFWSFIMDTPSAGLFTLRAGSLSVSTAE